jgi:hypothetical protein
MKLNPRRVCPPALVLCALAGLLPAAPASLAAQPGDPADLAPSAYCYRADRPADQNPPESWVLLMQYAGLPFDRPVDVQAPAVRQMLCALLWEEVRPIRNVELSWTGGRQPKPDEISVICLDTAVRGIHTWWNRQAPAREAELRATNGPTWFYTVPVDTFGIVVRCRNEASSFSVPEVRAYGPETWKQAEIEIEWGFEAARSALPYGGEIEAYDGVLGGIQPLAGDSVTRATEQRRWDSSGRTEGRRGIRFNLLYMGTSRRTASWPMDGRPEDIARTIVTVKTRSGSFSFLAADLEHGPILAPEYGFFVRASARPVLPPFFAPDSAATTARAFLGELQAKSLKTTRQRVREAPEQTWQRAVQAMWPGKDLPPMPRPEFPPAMKVDVPDERLVAQWNLGAWHLLRRAKQNEAGQWRFNDYPFAILASETYLILRVLDLMGMHKPAADGLGQWLELSTDLPKPVGHFSDGKGVLSHARNYIGGWGEKGFKEDLGGGMDSVHAMGPGAIGYQLAEHYWLTGDKDWLKAAAPRLIANADWILRQRGLLTRVIPGGSRLWCSGLQPAHQVTPDSGGMLMQFYESEAYYWLAVRRLADALVEVDPEPANRLAGQAEAYRKDLLNAVERSITYTPVVAVRDGTYHSFIPFACYIRGFASGPWNWRRPGSVNHVNGLYWDTVQSAAPLISPAGLLPAGDPRVQGFLDVLEDRLLLENERLAVRTPGYDPERDWFSGAGWQYQCGLERHANIHAAGDDGPCFLRTLLNQYAVDIQPGEYTFREHTVTGPPDKSFEESAFLERLRNALVMEEARTLWIARATPRAWLEQGKRIAVQDAPTWFGPATYELVSDAEHGVIRARVRVPERRAPEAVLVRFRHPRSSPIRSVAVNGADWTAFDASREVVRLEGVTGNVAVEVRY